MNKSDTAKEEIMQNINIKNEELFFQFVHDLNLAVEQAVGEWEGALKWPANGAHDGTSSTSVRPIMIALGNCFAKYSCSVCQGLVGWDGEVIGESGDCGL